MFFSLILLVIHLLKGGDLIGLINLNKFLFNKYLFSFFFVHSNLEHLFVLLLRIFNYIWNHICKFLFSSEQMIAWSTYLEWIPIIELIKNLIHLNQIEDQYETKLIVVGNLIISQQPNFIDKVMQKLTSRGLVVQNKLWHCLSLLPIVTE